MPLNLCIYATQFVEAKDAKRFPKLSHHWLQQAAFYGKWMGRVQAGLSPRTDRASKAEEPKHSVLLGLDAKKTLGKTKRHKLIVGVSGDIDEFERDARLLGKKINQYWNERRSQRLEELKKQFARLKTPNPQEN
jgi:hypothetical protein